MISRKNSDIDVRQIRSTDNPSDLFTKYLPALTLEKMVHKIEMRKLNHLNRGFYQGEQNTHCTLFSLV